MALLMFMLVVALFSILSLKLNIKKAAIKPKAFSRLSN